MQRRLALLVASLLATFLVAATATPAVAADDGGGYRPPADAPIVDPFRPPVTAFGAGNRGIDLGTAPGDPVWASADGEVVFAGPVAGTLHVVVLHDDGLRTSYSFLGSVSVRVGDDVGAGARVGTAGGLTHFGVRAGSAYLDPEALLEEPLRVRLVPTGSRTAAEEAARQRIVESVFGRGGDNRLLGAIRNGAAWARNAAGATVEAVRAGAALAAAAAFAEAAALWQELQTYAHYIYELNVLTHLARVAQAAHRWWEQRGDCTPEGAPPPPPPQGRRIVVLVGGLNSSSTNAAVDEVDTAALGYADGDVIRFSYAGGRTPDPADGLEGVTANPYDPGDTTVDLRVSAERLVALLREIRLEAPGVPVDVIAHSQGGVVARIAMQEIDPLDPRNPDIGALVTLGTPHHGADLATAGAQVARSSTGALALEAVDQVADLGLGPGTTSVAQLSETSPLISDLNEQALPTHVEVVSIAARGDIVVPAGRSHLDGASNAIVGVDGFSAHDELPGSAEALREMQLGLAGMAPTCDDFATFMYDHIASDVIGWGEDALGFVASLSARRFDLRVPGAVRPPTRSPGPVAVPLPVPSA